MKSFTGRRGRCSSSCVHFCRRIQFFHINKLWWRNWLRYCFSCLASNILFNCSYLLRSKDITIWDLWFYFFLLIRLNCYSRSFLILKLYFFYWFHFRRLDIWNFRLFPFNWFKLFRRNNLYSLYWLIILSLLLFHISLRTN